MGVVDRIHAADGTVVPSSRVRENTRVEWTDAKDRQRYGVEMKYGLNVEDILKKGIELGKRRKQGEREAPVTNIKRICLGVKKTSSVNESVPKRGEIPATRGTVAGE